MEGPCSEPPFIMRGEKLAKNALSVAAEFDTLTADCLGNKIGVDWNRLPEKLSLEKRNTVEFSRTEYSPVFLELAVAVTLELLLYRSKGQHSLCNIRKYQSWMGVLEFFNKLKLIAANNLNRGFRKLIALCPQDMPTRLRLIDKIHQPLAQNISVRFYMDDFIGAQGFGNLDRVQKATPPAGISRYVLPPQIIIEADNKIFILIQV